MDDELDYFLSKLLVRYPNLERHNSLVMREIISDAMLEMDRKRWGRLYERGLLALSAHLITLNQKLVENGDDSPTNQIASETAGQLSVSYVQNMNEKSADASFFSTTIYGQEYWRLLKTFKVGLMVV